VAPVPVGRSPCRTCDALCELQCARCHFAHYCSKACQRHDRKRHELECRSWWKDVPAEPNPCAACGRQASLSCPRCRDVHYCSPECQSEHAVAHEGSCPPVPGSEPSALPVHEDQGPETVLLVSTYCVDFVVLQSDVDATDVGAAAHCPASALPPHAGGPA
jgi:hypothetical protein